MDAYVERIDGLFTRCPFVLLPLQLIYSWIYLSVTLLFLPVRFTLGGNRSGRSDAADINGREPKAGLYLTPRPVGQWTVLIAPCISWTVDGAPRESGKRAVW